MSKSPAAQLLDKINEANQVNEAQAGGKITKVDLKTKIEKVFKKDVKSIDWPNPIKMMSGLGLNKPSRDFAVRYTPMVEFDDGTSHEVRIDVNTMMGQDATMQVEWTIIG